MRAFLVLASVAFSGGAVWFHFGARSSYSSYSQEQLAQLATELERVSKDGALNSVDAKVTQSFIDDERLRRPLAWGLTLIAVLCGVGAVRSPHSRSSRHSTEDQRLLQAIGRPSSTPADSRRAAAELLGVSATAPREVIEAAFAAQLAARKPSLNTSLPPDLRRLVVGQCEELAKARKLLLSASAQPPGV